MTLSWKKEFMSPNPDHPPPRADIEAGGLTLPEQTPANAPYRLVDQSIVEMGMPMFQLWMRVCSQDSFGGKPMLQFFQHPSVAKLSMELGDDDDQRAYTFGLRACAWLEELGSHSPEVTDSYIETIAAIWLIVKVFSIGLVHQDLDPDTNEIAREWWMKNVPCIQEMLE